jgi:hypothetical protein
MLTRKECERYSERVGDMARWLTTARQRLERRGETGELHRKTMAAIDALGALRMSAWYASCDGAGEKNGRSK